MPPVRFVMLLLQNACHFSNYSTVSLFVARSKNEKEFKEGIGVVLDKGYFYDDLTLNEMKSIISPAYKRWNNTIFTKYLDRFQLNLNQKISTLSKGMRMKYALALALSHEAELLIMDEPTSGLDPQIRTDVIRVLLEYVKNENGTVFFSTHITSDLDKAADNIIMINAGRIVFQEPKEELLHRHKKIEGSNINYLSQKLRDSFLKLDINDAAFTGIIKNGDLLNFEFLKDEKKIDIIAPTIEDIMLSYIKEEKHC